MCIYIGLAYKVLYYYDHNAHSISTMWRVDTTLGYNYLKILNIHCQFPGCSLYTATCMTVWGLIYSADCRLIDLRAHRLMDHLAQ